MTNTQLRDFKKSLHKSLKAKEQNNHLRISEQGELSGIKNIFFNKGNNNDILIICQDNNCHAIKNLFQDKPRMESCDFIVLLCKNKTLHTFFCEIKTSIYESEKALKQIESSKIFLQYLCAYYPYSSENCDKNFEINLDSAKNFYIYPASISQKKSICTPKKGNLTFKNVKVDSNGNATVSDIYKFFGI